MLVALGSVHPGGKTQGSLAVPACEFIIVVLAAVCGSVKVAGSK